MAKNKMLNEYLFDQLEFHACNTGDCPHALRDECLKSIILYATEAISGFAPKPWTGEELSEFIGNYQDGVMNAPSYADVADWCFEKFKVQLGLERHYHQAYYDKVVALAEENEALKKELKSQEIKKHETRCQDCGQQGLVLNHAHPTGPICGQCEKERES